MTMIKKNGHWVTVAGGQRMWVGTKAQLDAALAAGELEDGTAVMVTDDYGDTAPELLWAELNNTYVPAYGQKITNRDETGISGSVVCQSFTAKKLHSGDLLVQFGFGSNPEPSSGGGRWLFLNDINLRTPIGTLTLPDSMNLKDYVLSGRVHCASYKSGEIAVDISKSAGTNVITLKGFSNVANIDPNTGTYSEHASADNYSTRLYTAYFWSVSTVIMNYGRA